MKKVLLFIMPLMLLACGKSAFAPVEFSGPSGYNRLSGDDGSGTINQPGSQQCTNALSQRGYTRTTTPHQWKKRQNTDCGYVGVGYVINEIVVDDTNAAVCADPSILDGHPSPSGNLKEIRQLLAGGQLEGYLDGRNQPYEVHEIERHCAQQTRCSGTNDADAVLGRLVWMVKCEGSSNAFHAFLESFRHFDTKCDPDSWNTGSCFFNANRPLFPIVRYGAATEDSAPIVHLASAGVTLKTPADANALVGQVTTPCPVAADNVQPIDMVCTYGCYRGDQRLLTSKQGSYEQIVSAQDSARSIAVVARGSSLESPSYVNAPVGKFISTYKDSAETLLHINTASGASLVVTKNHPLVDAKGIMREAASLKPGDELLQASGAKDVIQKITSENFFGKVYNVIPVSPAPEDNLVVSEGIINGSHNYQTELHSLINRQVLRSNLADGY